MGWFFRASSGLENERRSAKMKKRKTFGEKLAAGCACVVVTEKGLGKRNTRSGTGCRKKDFIHGFIMVIMEWIGFSLISIP
jgi:hypothetical protein